MARNEIEGLILLLDVGSSMTTKLRNSSSSYLQSCVDTIQMIVQRKMFQTSKDELALILFGSNETGNVLWDGSSDHYRHVSVARPLSITDWQLLDFIQNKIAATNIDGDVLDGLVIASNHYQEDLNRTKAFKSKRIILFTDFSSGTSSDDDEIKSICSGLAKHSIRVDIISPFSDEDIERSQNPGNRGNDVGGDRARSSRDAGADETKTMTREQMKTQALLQQICEKTEGAMFSFDEALTLLSHYQSKAIKSMGTKFVLTIGENFKMPIVSMIKCKENKPDLFKFKKVNFIKIKVNQIYYSEEKSNFNFNPPTVN
jgi:ATP-dependent DNA helicase 2 subunit 2